MGGTPVSEIFRGVSGRVGFVNEEGERASTGEVLANECRMGRPGLGPLELGNLKLLVAGDPAREVVIASCWIGISKVCGLGGKP